MSWNIFEILETAADVFSAAPTSQIKDSEARVRKKDKKRDKYFRKKVNAGIVLATIVLFIIVFKDPLPAKDYVQTLIVTSLIGISISSLLFFILNLMQLYYFKSIFKLLFFSCSVIAFCIAFVLCVYYKSGVFI
nr:branched-chain amino acid ABC transporter substrate-binding protein [uncultured Chryseobacterium sp.]